MLRLLLAPQIAEPAGAYGLVCNATNATLDVTLVERHILAPYECRKFNLGAGDDRTVTLAATAKTGGLSFGRAVASTEGTQSIVLATKQADCEAASANRTCVLPTAAHTPRSRHPT